MIMCNLTNSDYVYALYLINIEDVLNRIQIPTSSKEDDQYLYRSDLERIDTYKSVVNTSTYDEKGLMKDIIKIYITMRRYGFSGFNWIEETNNIVYIPFSIKINNNDFHELLYFLQKKNIQPYDIKEENGLTTLNIIESIKSYGKLLECKEFYKDNILIENVLIQVEQILHVFHVVFK